jgi:hypothetical protein
MDNLVAMENENRIAGGQWLGEPGLVKSRLLVLLTIILAIAGCSHSSKPERTSFQTGAPWHEWANVNADVAMCYGIDHSLPARLKTWEKHGYVPYVMTGSAWGHYQDYLYGKFDGQNHLDEAQMDSAGHRVSHGGDVYYMSPGPDYGRYLCKGVKRAIDAGAKAVVLEEPEFWVRSGWEENFKREWKKYYGEDWVAPNSSADAQYRASKLKYFLYRRTLADVFAFVKSYSKQIGRDVKCYVATHSMINYSDWGIVSPESSLIDVGCDGYIAQVWTGTAQTPEFYNGVKRSRTFETAFLEYGQMQNLVRASGRTMWYLNDPVADDPHSPWSYYRRNWESTMVASLMQPEVWRYEVAPWPERVFKGKYPRHGKKPDSQSKPIPADYAVELQAVWRAMEDMKQPDWKWEAAGTQGLGVLVSDTMMFQRYGPQKSDPDLSSFFGLAMPLVASGVPAEPVQMESAARNDNFLARYRMLLLTYEGQKPPTPAVNEAIAKWVNNGGGLIVVDDDRDPYNAAHDWWNEGGRHYANPRQHLFELLHLRPEAEGKFAVGKGFVFYSRSSPSKMAHSNQGGEAIQRMCVDMAKKISLDWSQSEALVMRRGPYVVAAGLRTSPIKQDVKLTGRFVSLLDGDFPLSDGVTIEPGKRYLLVDAERYTSRVIAASARVTDEKADADGIQFKCQGIAETPGRALVRCDKTVKDVKVGGQKLPTSAWRQQQKWLWVDFDNSARQLVIRIQY